MIPRGGGGFGAAASWPGLDLLGRLGIAGPRSAGRRLGGSIGPLDAACARFVVERGLAGEQHRVFCRRRSRARAPRWVTPGRAGARGRASTRTPVVYSPRPDTLRLRRGGIRRGVSMRDLARPAPRRGGGVDRDAIAAACRRRRGRRQQLARAPALGPVTEGLAVATRVDHGEDDRRSSRRDRRRGRRDGRPRPRRVPARRSGGGAAAPDSRARVGAAPLARARCRVVDRSRRRTASVAERDGEPSTSTAATSPRPPRRRAGCSSSAAAAVGVAAAAGRPPPQIGPRRRASQPAGGIVRRRFRRGGVTSPPR